MSDDTLVADPAPADPPPKPPMTSGDKVRFVLRGIGQTLITMGLVVLLFVVYEVWITNIFAERNNRKQISALQNRWEHDTVDPLNLPGGQASTLPVGKGIAILYIPRLGKDYHFAVVQGSPTQTDAQLEQGTAHYGTTQLPGQLGNFAIAGHRVGKGEPFLNIDKLRSGDAVIVETKSYWYVYRVKGSPAGGNPEKDTLDADTLPGREIVDPSDGQVLLPFPDHPEVALADARERLMTMTTCHPKFTASHRMIVYSKLATKVKAVGNKMPASINALYSQVGV
jgi:sortase A